MRFYKPLLIFLLGLFFTEASVARNNPHLEGRKERNESLETRSFREDCDNAINQVDMSINNVRARLTTGGDVWWNGTDGVYVVPKVPATETPVSSIFAGAVWLGGVDPAGNLKLAAQTYGRNGGDFDFWPGPLNPTTGTVNQDVCANWDRFFTVLGENIQEHLRNK